MPRHVSKTYDIISWVTLVSYRGYISWVASNYALRTACDPRYHVSVHTIYYWNTRRKHIHAIWKSFLHIVWVSKYVLGTCRGILPHLLEYMMTNHDTYRGEHVVHDIMYPHTRYIFEMHDMRIYMRSENHLAHRGVLKYILCTCLGLPPYLLEYTITNHDMWYFTHDIWLFPRHVHVIQDIYNIHPRHAGFPKTSWLCTHDMFLFPKRYNYDTQNLRCHVDAW